LKNAFVAYLKEMYCTFQKKSKNSMKASNMQQILNTTWIKDQAWPLNRVMP